MEELEGVGSYLRRCSARREADGDELSAARWGRGAELPAATMATAVASSARGRGGHGATLGGGGKQRHGRAVPARA